MRRALDSGRPACINIITDLDAVFGDTEQSREGVSRQEKAEEEAEGKDKKSIEMRYYEKLETR